jgi:hypothetical protein
MKTCSYCNYGAHWSTKTILFVDRVAKLAFCSEECVSRMLDKLRRVMWWIK